MLATLTLVPMLMLMGSQPSAGAPGGSSAPAHEPPKSERPSPEQPKPEQTKPEPARTPVSLAVAYPHPMISEVLFAVPTTGETDANKSGKREVSGDEFIEIVNPHDRAIDLRGYTLTDGSPTAKTTLRFVFPAMTLPPRAVVVVFNGRDAKIPGPVGDTKAAPPGVNENFHKGIIFTARVASSRVSFSNAGDAACLRAPDGKPLQRIRWGKADDKAGGTGFVLDEIASTSSKGSVQRDGAGKDGMWKSHVEVDSSPFSPGVFAPHETKSASAASPATASTPTPPVSK